MKLFNRRHAVIAHDLGMVALAWTLAVALRYAFEPGIGLDWLLQLHTRALPIVLIIQSILFWYYGLYRSLWRFASVPDLWNISRSAIVGTLAIALGLVLLDRMEGMPRSSLLLYPLFLIFLLGAPRLLYRLWREDSLRFLWENSFQPHRDGQRVLILGAGQAGEMLAREMLRSGEYAPVGFLDDEARLRGVQVQGVPVLGNLDLLPHVAESQQIDLIMLAMPSATDQQMQRIVELCEQTRRPFRTLPKLQEMVSVQPSLKELRAVSIEDLLGRDKIQLDWNIIQTGIRGKVVMVSGGGGSIGSELCRQIARLNPAALVILESCEFNLYRIDMQLQQSFPRLRRHCRLGSVADPIAARNILAEYQPEMIFHAAAYKHVPLLQSQVRETARNNVLGTRILAEAAMAHGCRSFVLISTDKAVNPTNIMGATKRVAEILCQALNGLSATRFITVRFGNVLASAGSVVPLFQDQIANGGPVTVTHPQISRYFMTIPEACELILQAGAMGQGGEIFVLDMGQPVRIVFLAEQLIRLSGKTPGKDIQIVFTGLRPGEKLHEELFHADEEQYSKTRHQKIMLASCRSASWRQFAPALDELCRLCDAYDEAGLRHALRQMLPEFQERE
jgi:FlaA1/EpsC-like NDP-sugar epimerase